VAGRRDVSLKRAARFGDAWLSSVSTPEDTAEGYAQVLDHAREFGRDGSDISLMASMFAYVADHDAAGAYDRVRGHMIAHYKQDFGPLLGRFLIGGPDELVGRLSAYASVGVSTFMIELACAEEEYAEQMERLANEILPHVSVPARTTAGSPLA
jgi:alkanesulfonate monooxygenase SsuD/methylene tetrahydromethanopterin reductase-like flavin-dependent oxidoreductase (luciferase family)